MKILNPEILSGFKIVLNEINKKHTLGLKILRGG
jgi:hypothetical protein